MAIMLTTIWTPNNSGATVQLTQNLTIARDAMRADGYKADVLALIPGGGGVPGEMGLVVDYEDADAYVAALDQGVSPSLAKAQETMQYSDSKPERTATWMEIPGLETSVTAPLIFSGRNTEDQTCRDGPMIAFVDVEVQS